MTRWMGEGGGWGKEEESFSRGGGGLFLLPVLMHGGVTSNSCTIQCILAKKILYPVMLLFLRQSQISIIVLLPHGMHV